MVMDAREGMSFPGSAPYYLNRRIDGSGVPGPGSNTHGAGLHHPSVFKTISNPNIQMQQHNVGVNSGGWSGSTFRVENPPPGFSQGGMDMAMVPSGGSSGEIVKKKRGRPRKYGPDGSNMSLGLSPMSGPSPPSREITPGEKARKGRPPGSGWKQGLAHVGEWMNSSAGLAFTPHVLHVGIGEDVAAKILAFAQQRARALCVLSASGSVSAVTIRQPTTSDDGTLTYEGNFEILCLSGSYLLADSGGPRNRTGGISISFCSPDGQILGGAIGGRLIASNPVQVVTCSFVYGSSSKAKSKSESETKDESYLLQSQQSAEKTSTPVTAASSQSLAPPNSGPSVWPSGSDVKNSEIDLSH